LAFAVLLIMCFVLESNSFNYQGVDLLLSAGVPLTFAAMSEMFIIMVGDIDFGLGFFVGLCNVVVARWFASDPGIAVVVLLMLIVGYMAIGALIEVRRVPAILVTLGASFIWLGLGLTILPIPGGSSPPWLADLMAWQPPLVPFPILVSVVLGTAAYALCYWWPYGSIIRGAGSNREAVRRAGWSTLKVRIVAYGLAGLFGVLAGVALTGITASGDATASANVTLLAIAAVILGGAEFSGGIAAPVGAVFGALSISLVGLVLAFLSISSDFQTGAQGLILILVVGGRVMTRRRR
jgi:ribose/xylose/arabinose/galactoside ABC-type transport system permease subunit